MRTTFKRFAQTSAAAVFGAVAMFGLNMDEAQAQGSNYYGETHNHGRCQHTHRYNDINHRHEGYEWCGSAGPRVLIPNNIPLLGSRPNINIIIVPPAPNHRYYAPRRNTPNYRQHYRNNRGLAPNVRRDHRGATYPNFNPHGDRGKSRNYRR